MSGVGKTSVGIYLANRLKWDLLDLDFYIENRVGKAICEIFKEYGEETFRVMESEALVENIDRSKLVLSTGGGIVSKEKNRHLLKNKGAFYLTASLDTLYRNIVNDKDKIRPLLDTEDLLSGLSDIYNGRKAYYEECSGYIINVDGKTISQVGDEILSLM